MCPGWRYAELAFRLGEVAKLHGPAYEGVADAYRRLKLYPEEVTRLYERAVQAYTAFAEEAAAARCHGKFRQQ